MHAGSQSTRRRRITFGSESAGCAALLVLAGCIQEPSERLFPPSVTVRGQVVDSSRVPVVGALVALQVGHGHKLPGPEGDPHDPDPSPIIRTYTDSAGRFSLTRDGLRRVIDFVAISTQLPGCSGGGFRGTIPLRAVATDDPVAVDTVLVADGDVSRATLGMNQVCARIEAYVPSFSGTLALRFDSFAPPLVWGRWEVVYHYSRAGTDQPYAFVGVQFNGRVGLRLMHPPDRGYACRQFDLAGPVDEAGRWGALEMVSDDGCLNSVLDGVHQPYVFTRDTSSSF